MHQYSHEKMKFINNTHMRFQSHLWAVGVSTLSFLLEAQTIIIMSSNKRSHPDHFVGLLCYKCKRTDFGGSARHLSSHVRYCNGPPQQSYYQKKKKKILHSDNSFTTCHPNGMSQFPFNMAHRNIVGDTNEVCFSNFDEHLELDNPDQLFSNENQINIMNSADFQSALVNDQIIPDNTAVPSNIHHPSIQPTTEASKPFNLDVGIPSCSEFHVQLASICNSHRTDMKLFNEINQLVKNHSIGRKLSFSSDNLSTRQGFVKSIGKSLKTERLQHTDVRLFCVVREWHIRDGSCAVITCIFSYYVNGKNG